MRLAEFEVISGAIDVLLVVMGIVLLVRVSILRKAIKRRKSKEETQGAPSSASPPPALSDLALKESAYRQEMERERSRFETLVRDAERMRAELQVLFYDIESLVDDLGKMKASSSVEVSVSSDAKNPSPPGESASGRMYDLPPESEPPRPLPKRIVEEKPLKETVLTLSREGHSVPEIAAAIGRSEGEVAFLLSMEKVGQPE
ncbi:MAG: hypothetical protein ACP5OP_04005 [Leptospirillia bacterium]